MTETTGALPELTVGIDLGDRFSWVCGIDRGGSIVEEGRLTTTEASLRRRFGGGEAYRIVLEVGTHSPWVVPLLEELGHEVFAANPRKLRLVYENDRKSDQVDAEYLARIGRLDPKLLAPIRHRGQQARTDLAVIRTRDALVRTRTKLVNHVRGTVKSLGGRVPRCSTDTFSERAGEGIPEALGFTMEPVLEMIRNQSRQIREYDHQIRRLCEKVYPETEVLQTVPGVGPLTALCFVLTLEDPTRFKRSRDVGPYLGLVPRRGDSGETSPQLRISKAGDELLRRLLVGSAHYILGPFGPETNLRRWGLQMAERGGKNAKKRAVVAVARKLAVLLHHLWLTGEVFQPLHNSPEDQKGLESAAA
jgi:transposase